LEARSAMPTCVVLDLVNPGLGPILAGEPGHDAATILDF
jgi:hypothetical protein